MPLFAEGMSMTAKNGQSRRKSPSANMENCVTTELAGQKMSAKKALKMVKAEELLHNHIKIPILKGYILRRLD